MGVLEWYREGRQGGGPGRERGDPVCTRPQVRRIEEGECECEDDDGSQAEDDSAVKYEARAERLHRVLEVVERWLSKCDGYRVVAAEQESFSVRLVMMMTSLSLVVLLLFWSTEASAVSDLRTAQ